VAAVVTAEAPIRRHVSDVVRIDTEGHFHRREHVVAVDVLQPVTERASSRLIECTRPV
jgi:hypothetical protein